MCPRVCGRIVLAGLASALALTLLSPSFAQSQRDIRGYAGTLTEPRFSEGEDGRIVISLDATGELRGLLTLELEPDGAGGLTGKWGLVVRHVQDLNPDGTVATDVEHHEPPSDHGEPGHHPEYIAFVNEGTVHGTVQRASLHYAPDGSVTGVETVRLLVDAGSGSFDGATGGGEIVPSPLDPNAAVLSLNF